MLTKTKKRALQYNGKLCRGLKSYARLWALDHPQATREIFINEMTKYNPDVNLAYQYYYEFYRDYLKIRRQTMKKYKRTTELIPTLNGIAYDVYICSNCLNFATCKAVKYPLTFANIKLICSTECDTYKCLKEEHND